MDNKVKILFLAADPSDAARLRLGQELRDIRDNLQRSQKRDAFVLESRESVRPGDVTQSILDVEAQIIHFSGHGISTGELCFEDSLGQTHSVQPDALASLFELVAEEVNCVVLNACHSETQAKAIAKHIPYVVGMNQSIGDRAAIIFAVGFYKALGAGHSFEKAYKFAQVEMRLESIPENLAPVLYIKNNAFSPLESSEPASSSQTSTSLTDIEIENLEKVTTAFSSKSITVEDAIRRFDISPIIKRFGTWAVTTYGVECLTTPYPIEMDRVGEEDWVDHMRKKNWPDMVDFSEALRYARNLNNIKYKFSVLGRSLRVFLCHGSEDKPAVRNLYHKLLAAGIDPWLDEEKLLPGQDWKYEIAKAVRASDVFLVLLSSTSTNKTGFVQQEIKYALDVAEQKPEGTIFLIPVRLEECIVPEQLSKKQWLDLFQYQGFDRLIQSLQAYIDNYSQS